MKKYLSSLFLFSMLLLSCAEDSKVNVYEIEYFENLKIPDEYNRSVICFSDTWKDSYPNFEYESRNVRYIIKNDKKLLISARGQYGGYSYYLVGQSEFGLYAGFFIKWEDGKYLTDTTTIKTNLRYHEIKKLIPSFRGKYNYQKIDSFVPSIDLLKKYYPDSLLIQRQNYSMTSENDSLDTSTKYHDKFWQTFINIPKEYLSDYNNEKFYLYLFPETVKYYKDDRVLFKFQFKIDSTFIYHTSILDSVYGRYICEVSGRKGFYIEWKRLDLTKTEFIESPEINSNLPEKYLRQLYPEYKGKVIYKKRDFELKRDYVPDWLIVRYHNDYERSFLEDSN